MEERYPRFRCMLEPSGTWMVWDDMTGAPAALGGFVLTGRSEERARAACGVLKRIYRSRLDARSTNTASRPQDDPDAEAARWTAKAS